MSNRVVMGVLVVVALVLLGAGVTWFRNSTIGSPSPVPSLNPEGKVQAETASPATTSMSLKDLWNNPVSQKCTFTDTGNSSSGTVYVGQGKMRGDFTYSAKEQSTESHMIADGRTAYLWSNNNQGMKISMEKFIDASSPATASANQANNLDVNQKIDFNCEGWSVDSSLFQVPANVQFSDLGAITPQDRAGSGQPIDTTAACQACDRLSGAAKDQCKKALSC